MGTLFGHLIYLHGLQFHTFNEFDMPVGRPPYGPSVLMRLRPLSIVTRYPEAHSSL